jgi:hypothetical protein
MRAFVMLIALVALVVAQPSTPFAASVKPGCVLQNGGAIVCPPPVVFSAGSAPKPLRPKPKPKPALVDVMLTPATSPGVPIPYPN